jgi:hypothetical protein
MHGFSLVVHRTGHISLELPRGRLPEPLITKGFG